MANKENVKKWVDALEGGEYDQCEGALHKEGSFCCLGVATDLYLKETGKEWGMDIHGQFTGPGGNVSTLGYQVQEWLGIDYTNPGVWIESLGERTSLAELNDGFGYRFTEIAKLIRGAWLDEVSADPAK